MVEFSKIIKKAKQEEQKQGRGIANDFRDEKSHAHHIEPPGPQESKLRQVVNEPLIEDEAEEPVIKNIKPLFLNKSPRGISPDFTERQPAEAEKSKDEVIEPVRPQVASSRMADSVEIYQNLFELGGMLFSPGVDYTKVDTARIITAIAETAGVISAGDEKLIEQALTYIIKEEQFYLNQHSVNCCIISLQIGVGAGFEMGHLIELGIAAFLHDIGMTRFEDVANLTRKLTDKEYEDIKSHVVVGSEILKKINHGISDTIIAVQNEIHERLDGSGYPSGKKAIHDYARIIAVADAFESMLHPRPFRPRYSIMDVYKRIFEQKAKYDQAYIKILVDRVGFFPNGSFVQLNTKEVGKVIGQNARSPLRPVVRIVYAENGQQLYEEDMKDINLIKYPTIHVKKCFLEESHK